MHYVLIYEMAADYMERRGAYRNEHLNLAWDAHDRGDVVLGGAFADPADGAMLVFKGDSPAAAERFVASDPYVKNGLVAKWRVRKWTTVVGDQAATPIRST